MKESDVVVISANTSANPTGEIVDTVSLDSAPYTTNYEENCRNFHDLRKSRISRLCEVLRHIRFLNTENVKTIQITNMALDAVIDALGSYTRRT